MATQQQIDAERLSLLSGPSETDFSSMLSSAIQERTKAGQPIIDLIEKEKAELPAVRAELEQKLQNVFDPFARRSLVERRISSRKGATRALEAGFEAQQGQIADTIRAATEGFKSQAAQRMAVLDALQDSEDRRIKLAQQQFSNNLRLQANARAAASAQRAATKSARGYETKFEKIQRLAAERGGNISLDDEGGLALSVRGHGTPLTEFISETGLDVADVLGSSMNPEDAMLLDRIQGKGGSTSTSSGSTSGRF